MGPPASRFELGCGLAGFSPSLLKPPKAQQLGVDGTQLPECIEMLSAPFHQGLELGDLVVGNDLDVPVSLNAVGQRPHRVEVA